MLKAYYQLAKPGIIYGNLLPAIAAFFLASRGHANWFLLLWMIIGLSLIIGSACVFNNVYDQDIDAKMERTKKRGEMLKTIGKTQALFYATILLLLGILSLSLFSTLYSLLAALIGFLVYVFLYTPLKRITVHDTLIGAIAGATPPVVGYAAVTNKFDVGALLLFLILVFWQMPHFYAIAIRRQKDYEAAGIPVLPIKYGIKNTKIQMLLFCTGFIIAAALLTYYRIAGYSYLIIAETLGIVWLIKGLAGYNSMDNTKWAKGMFLLSLIVLTALSAALAVGSVLP